MARTESRTYRLAKAALLAVLIAVTPIPAPVHGQQPPAAKDAPAESPTERLWNQGEIALSAKKYKEALANFTELEKKADSLPDAAKAAILFRKATCQVMLKDWANADASLQLFLSKYPKGTENMLGDNNMRGVVRLTLIEAFANQSKWNEALKDLEMLRKPSPEIREEDRVNAFTLTAKVLEEKAKGQSDAEVKTALNQGMVLLQQATSNGMGTPERREAANSLVEIYTKLGMTKEAEQLRAEIEAKGLGSPSEIVRANVQRLEIGDARFKSAEEASDAKAKDDLYRQALSNYQGALRRATLARNIIKAVEIKQFEVESLNRAFPKPDDAAKARIDKAKEEVEAFKKIQAEFDANKDYDAVISYRIGLCLLELKRPWEAFIAFRDIFENNPGFQKISGAYFYYIEALRRINDYSKAQLSSREFLTKFPESAEAGPIAVGLGEISIEQEDYNKAIEQFKWAKANVKNLPADALQEIDFGIIRCYFANVDWPEARKATEEFLTKYPKSPAREPALYMQGLTWFFQGKYKETRDSLNRYVTEFPKGQYLSDVSYRQGIVAMNVESPDAGLAIAKKWLADYGADKSESIVSQLPEVHTLIGDALTKKADSEAKKAADLDYKVRVTGDASAKAALMAEKKRAETAKENFTVQSIEAYTTAARCARTNPQALDFILGELGKLLPGRGDYKRMRDLYQELYDWDHNNPKALGYLYEVIKATEKLGDKPEFTERAERTQRQYGVMLDAARRKIEEVVRAQKANTPEHAAAKADLTKLSDELAKELATIEAARQQSVAAARKAALDILSSVIAETLNDRKQEGSERLIAFLAEKLARRVKKVRPGAAVDPSAYNLKQAEADLDAVLQLKNDSTLIAQARAYYGKATLSILARDPAQAEAMWRKIADLYKAEELSPAILGTVGDFLASKNDPKAEAYFTYLTEHGRSSDYADFGFAGLADIRLSQGKAKEALAICEEAIANNITMSKEKDLRFCKARALLELGKFDEAKKEFKEIAETKEWRGETTAGCLFHLGLIEERQNHYSEAVVLYQRCIVAWKKYERWTAKAYLRSGILLGEKLGQKDAARQTFNEMITKDRIKDTPEAQEARKRLTAF